MLQTGDDGVEHPVSFFSRKFNSYQLNYSTVEKEALALIWALQHFEVYVGGGVETLVVYTDHNHLTFLHSLQNPNQRLMRWCLFLQPYTLDIRHVKGTENVFADALSLELCHVEGISLSTFTCSKKFEFLIVSDIVRTFNMHVITLIRPTSDLLRTISDNSKSDKNT